MGYNGTILFPGHHTGNLYLYLIPWCRILFEKLIVTQNTFMK